MKSNVGSDQPESGSPRLTARDGVFVGAAVFALSVSSRRIRAACTLPWLFSVASTARTSHKYMKAVIERSYISSPNHFCSELVPKPSERL